MTRHKKLRARQLEIEEELRARQIVKERDDLLRAKNFAKQKKEEHEDTRARTAKANSLRTTNMEKAMSFNLQADLTGFEAYP